MTDIEELIAFLREALREDEALAQKPVSEHHEPERWGITYRMPGGWDLICRDGRTAPVGSVEPGFAHHIARWDPARVLAEVEAKRRILDLWDNAMESYGAEAAEAAVRALAQPYADRPGFQPEWRLT